MSSLSPTAPAPVWDSRTGRRVLVSHRRTHSHPMASPPMPTTRQTSYGSSEVPAASSAASSSSTSKPHSRTASLLSFSFRNKASAAHSHSQSLQAVPERPQQPANPPSNTQGAGIGLPTMSESNMERPNPPTPNSTQQQEQPPPPPPHQRSASVNQPPPPQLHPEIRSIVQLSVAHAHKVYFSGPLIRRIERQADGNRPHKDDGWRDVWAQLGGTTLSVWDMKEIEEANKRGEEVPPTYVNVTDAVCYLRFESFTTV